MHNSAICLDSGQVNFWGRGDVEAEETGEIVERLVQDLVGSPDQPAGRGNGHIRTAWKFVVVVVVVVGIGVGGEGGEGGKGAYHVKAVKTTKGLKYRAKGSI